MHWIDKTRTKASELWHRSLNQQVRIAVTGLSGSGKTAFISSFINQLLHAPSSEHLSFFRPVAEERLKATKLGVHQELHIPAFDYIQSLKRLTDAAPQWPHSTRGVSQAQIKCRFTIKDSLYRKLKKESTVTLDIIDYPGEWLLDLPLLDLSYKDWSKLCLDYLKSERRKPFTDKVQSVLAKQNYQDKINEAEVSSELAQLSSDYTDALVSYRDKHNDYSLALPGRFILPGELKDAPALSFFPVLNEDVLSLDWEQFEDYSMLKVLEKRYDYYCKKVIKPFFEDYFSQVDRQIVLIDTTSVLESGYDVYQDLKGTIEKLLDGFSYGRSNWLKRLFSPSIDKLMIATTKSDLVPPDQHASLESFMQKMVAQAKNDVGYEGVEVDTMAISAIATSEPVSTEHEGKKLLCVKGLDTQSGGSVIHYPGKVPATTMTREQWRALNIDFSPFALPELNPDEPLPHIRMDKVMQFLIGDKFI